jgi:DNA-binding phage protein
MTAIWSFYFWEEIKMGKTKISKKRRVSSIDKLPSVKLKAGVKIRSHNPDEKLQDVNFISEALVQCLFEGDIEAFKEIIRAHYESIEVETALKRAGLTKSTYYEAIRPQTGNPSLKTIAKMLHGLKAS